MFTSFSYFVALLFRSILFPHISLILLTTKNGGGGGGVGLDFEIQLILYVRITFSKCFPRSGVDISTISARKFIF